MYVFGHHKKELTVLNQVSSPTALKQTFSKVFGLSEHVQGSVQSTEKFHFISCQNTVKDLKI